MKNNDKDGPDPSPIQALEAPLGSEAITRVDRPRAALSPRERQSATERPKVPPQAKISGVRLRSSLILVAHDCTDVREGLADRLRTMGFRTVQAESGILAVELARALKPDAILLDFAMVEADGVQTASWLKRDESTRQIPILMLGTQPKLENDVTCDAYLEKPCDPQVVAAVLRSLVLMRDARAAEGG